MRVPVQRLPVEPTPSDCAYAAGFFDGEGSVTIAQGSRPGSRWPVYNMRVIVGQNEVTPLLWLVHRWGGTVVVRAAYGTRKAHHTWTCFARQAERFLRDVKPYLIVKYARADLAIRFQTAMQRPGSNAKRETLRPFFAECRAEMLRMNDYKRKAA